jgi:hypothetical protein
MAEIVDEYTDSSWDSETLTPKVVDHNNTTIGFRVARPHEVARIHEITVREIGPEVASIEVMQRVYEHDPASMWVVLRGEPGSKGFRIVGTYGYLFLNQEGVALLEDGLLDTRNPPNSVLALPDERPAQIYIWLMVARKLTALLAPLVIKGFPKARYGGVPLAARAGTIGGLKSVLPSAILDAQRGSSGVGDVFKIDIARTSVGAKLREAGQRQ